MGERSRRKRRTATVSRPARPASASRPAPAGAARPGRGELRDAAARSALAPLAPGERPGAVTVAALVAALLAVANLIAAFAVDLGDEGSPGFAIVQSVVLVVAAGGMWRARYWAVLGFQALLALQILVLSLALLRVEKPLLGVGIVVLVAALGYLFWKLVRAMARLQMPERRPTP